MSNLPPAASTGTSAGARGRPLVPGRDLRLRRMGLQDLPFVVGTHLHYFPESFFSRLGPRFVTRYYRTFLDGPLAAAIVAEAEGEIAGYLVGILDLPRHRSLLLRHHGAALACAGVLGMCRRPWLLWEFASTRVRRYARALRRSGQPGAEAPRTAGRLAVLSHVAVADPCRLRGVGTQLINEFLQLAEAAGCARACLLTRAGESGAGGYYASHQWERVQVPASSASGAFEQYQRGLRQSSEVQVPTMRSSAGS